MCHKAIIVKVFFILAGRSRRVRDAKEKLGHQTFIILCSELILEMCDRQSQRILFAVQRLNASRGHKMQTYSELTRIQKSLETPGTVFAPDIVFLNQAVHTRLTWDMVCPHLEGC